MSERDNQQRNQQIHQATFVAPKRFKVKSKQFNPGTRQGVGVAVGKWRTSEKDRQFGRNYSDTEPVTIKDGSVTTNNLSGTNSAMPRHLTDEELFAQARDTLMMRMENSRNEMAQVSAASYIFSQIAGMPTAKQVNVNIDANSEEEVAAVRDRVLSRISRLAAAKAPLSIEGPSSEPMATKIHTENDDQTVISSDDSETNGSY